MGTERVTLKDIAKACGYTANTVSRGMRDDPRLPATTRLKIREAAEKLGYRIYKAASAYAYDLAAANDAACRFHGVLVDSAGFYGTVCGSHAA